MLTYKNIFYNYASPAAVKREVADLEVFLEKTNKQKNHLVVDVVGGHKLANAPVRYLIIARIAIGIALCFTLLNFRHDSGMIIAPLFLIAGLLYFTQQAFTKTAVTAMDSLIILPVLFYALITYNKTLLFLVIFTEIINGLIWLFASENNISLKNTVFSETKISLQYAVLGAATLFWPASPNVVFVALLWIALIFMIISITIKTIEIKSHYEARKSENLQHTLGQEGGVKAA